MYPLFVEIIDCGDKTNIGIGICPGKTYPVNRMPGWNRWSIAYHADDGGCGISLNRQLNSQSI